MHGRYSMAFPSTMWNNLQPVFLIQPRLNRSFPADMLCLLPRCPSRYACIPPDIYLHLYVLACLTHSQRRLGTMKRAALPLILISSILSLPFPSLPISQPRPQSTSHHARSTATSMQSYPLLSPKYHNAASKFSSHRTVVTGNPTPGPGPGPPRCTHSLPTRSPRRIQSLPFGLSAVVCANF